jgi:hypothetical protein
MKIDFGFKHRQALIRPTFWQRVWEFLTERVEP